MACASFLHRIEVNQIVSAPILVNRCKYNVEFTGMPKR